MGKNKQERFEQISNFDNVLEINDYQKEESPKPRGLWGKKIFQNSNPITLELACGKGAYTLELARRYPNRNFVGIDIKGSRIWKGAKRARQEQLHNVRFLRIYIDHLQEYFAEEEVDEIWITFPDPYPKGSDRTKRLTSHKFLDQYRRLLSEPGLVHLKTDSAPLFEFSKRSIQRFGGTILEEVTDVYKGESDGSEIFIQTDFEQKHLSKGRTIKYLKFSLPTSE